MYWCRLNGKGWSQKILIWFRFFLFFYLTKLCMRSLSPNVSKIVWKHISKHEVKEKWVKKKQSKSTPETLWLGKKKEFANSLIGMAELLHIAQLFYLFLLFFWFVHEIKSNSGRYFLLFTWATNKNNVCTKVDLIEREKGTRKTVGMRNRGH